MFHKMNGSHEHVNDAGVNCVAFHQAKLGMQLKWIFPDQLVGMLYANGLKLRCNCLANIRQRFQLSYCIPVRGFQGQHLPALT